MSLDNTSRIQDRAALSVQGLAVRGAGPRGTIAGFVYFIAGMVEYFFDYLV